MTEVTHHFKVTYQDSEGEHTVYQSGGDLEVNDISDSVTDMVVEVAKTEIFENGQLVRELETK